jgi:site-specific recombinase XerD
VSERTVNHGFLRTSTEIQLLLGHQCIETTSRYVHVSQRHLARLKSPLDRLDMPKGEKPG